MTFDIDIFKSSLRRCERKTKPTKLILYLINERMKEADFTLPHLTSRHGCILSSDFEAIP